MPTLDFKPEKPPALSINTAAYSTYAVRDETTPLLAKKDGAPSDGYEPSPNRRQVAREYGPSAGLRTAKIAVGVVSAPLKVVLTPIAGAVIGATAMGGWWGGNGVVLGATFLAILGDHHPSSKSKAQEVFESAVSVVVGIPLSVTMMVVGGTVGLGLGAARGGLEGFINGIGEGYQASWDNRMPGLSPGTYLS